MKVKSDAMTAQWEKEKSALEEVRKIRASLDSAKVKYTQALSQGDNENAARLKYGVIPELEKKLKEQE